MQHEQCEDGEVLSQPMTTSVLQAKSGRLFDLLTDASPCAIFLTTPNAVITFGDMRQRSLAIASGMFASGLQKGDCIALLLNNTPDWLAVAFAAWRIGLSVMSLNPRLGSKEVGDALHRTGAKALFYAPGYRNGTCGEAVERCDPLMLASLRVIVSCDEHTPKGGPLTVLRIRIADLKEIDPVPDSDNSKDPCLYVATSGTTSLPKIVVHIQERVYRHVHDAAAAIGFGANGRTLLAVPFCGGFGFSVAMTSIAAQVPIVLMDQFDPWEASQLVQTKNVTHVMGTNDMLSKMLAATSGNRPFPTLRMFGHANFTPGLTDLPAEAERRGVPMRGFYGLSETLAFVAARPANAPLQERADGGGHLVCSNAKFRIVEPDTGEHLPIDTVGEIQIRSPNVMIEYLGDPVRSVQAFTHDGYLRTGDLGTRQADGGFTFITRINDVLRIGGYLVSPEEIEEVIKNEPGVATCQVVAVPLPQGPRPVAFVIPFPGMRINVHSALERCRGSLAVYKIPVRIFEIDGLPVTDGPNGTKVKRNVLREIAADRLAAE